MSSCTDNVGHRLLTSMIDHHAIEITDKVYASIPRSEDLAEGFLDVTYRQFANAVNHASWWLDMELGVCQGSFDTFAYSGPKDLRYPILAVAAAKVGRTILFPSAFVTAEAQIHLLNATQSRTYLCTESNRQDIEDLVKKRPNTRIVLTPNLDDWMCTQGALKYEYTKTWEIARNDPWIIFHTTGTTGLPKPIVYTNSMMTSLDATLIMPEASQELQTHHYMNERWYSPLPSLHFVGMTTVLQMPVLLNMVVVLGPANLPATAELVDQILKLGKVTGMILPPSLLEDLCRNPNMLKQVQSLKYVHYVGAPLNKSVGDLISRHVKLVSALGSTETGPYFVKIHSNSEWNYHHFCPSIGLTFEPRSEDLYEAVFCRKDGLERWQQIFSVYPHLEQFPTKDLLTRHPTKPDLWAYACRSDDLINLSHGNSLPVSGMEAIITSHPDVRAAIIGGNGRARPFLILDILRDQIPAHVGQQDKPLIENVWPVCNEANQACVKTVRLTKELVIIVSPQKPVVLSAKRTVMRRATIELYQDEVDGLYEDSDQR